MNATIARLSFEDLAKRQAPLLALRRLARTGRHLEGWERERFWADRKGCLRGLVGWHVAVLADDLLGTTHAYDVAYGELLNTLDGR
jgi:hypothetical protein